MYCCSQIWHGYITQSRTDWPESALPNNTPLGQGDTQNVEKVTSTRGHSLHYIFQRKIWQNPAFFHTVTCVECSGCRVHGIQDGDCVLMVAVAAPALQTTQLHFPAIALRPSARPKVLGTRFGLDTHTGTEEAGRQYCKPGVELCFGICHYVTHKTDLMFVTALPTTFTWRETQPRWTALLPCSPFSPHPQCPYLRWRHLTLWRAYSEECLHCSWDVTVTVSQPSGSRTDWAAGGDAARARNITWRMVSRAENEPSRYLKLYNHGWRRPQLGVAYAKVRTGRLASWHSTWKLPAVSDDISVRIPILCLVTMVWCPFSIVS